MGTVVVVLLSPVGDEDLGFEQRVELLDREQLVAHPGSVGLDPGVLPGRAGVDVARAGSGEAAPVPEGVGGELGAVVHPDEAREGAPPADDLVEAGDDGVGVDGVGDQVGQRLPGELVDDVEDLEDPSRDGDVDAGRASQSG